MSESETNLGFDERVVSLEPAVAERPAPASARLRMARWLAIGAAILIAGISVAAGVASFSPELPVPVTTFPVTQPTVAQTGALTIDAGPSTETGR